MMLGFENWMQFSHYVCLSEKKYHCIKISNNLSQTYIGTRVS